MISSKLKVKLLKDVQETQLLLENPEEKRYVDMMRSLSPDGEFVKNEHLVGLEIERKKISNKYGDTFKESEILAECARYHLHFDRARNYKGSYSINFIKNLKRFIDEKELVLDDHMLKDRIYILAPAQRSDYGRLFNDKLKDPLIFYRETVNDTNYFVVIDGDRSYVNLKNYYLGKKYYSETTFLFIALIESLFYVTTFTLLMSFFFFPSLMARAWLFVLIAFLSALRMLWYLGKTKKLYYGKDLKN